MTDICPDCGSDDLWQVDCEFCGSSGEDPENHGEDCPECEGLGYEDGIMECAKCGMENMPDCV